MKSRILALAFLTLFCLGAHAAQPLPEGAITNWVILGPFPNPAGVQAAGNRGGFDVDYLTSLGGESAANIQPSTTIGTATAKAVSVTGTLDLTANYKEADHVLAYACAEITSPRDHDVLFLLGSDDGAKVWVNGKQAFEIYTARGCVPRQDRFRARLHKGANPILVKVENGTGGWGLILEAFTGKNAARIEAGIERDRVAREFMNQQLALGRADWQGYVFQPGSTPTIIWRNVDEVRKLVGDVPLKVRWFDGDLNEVTSPAKPGRYAAYIEGKLRNGTPVKRAMSFYCAPPEMSFWADWGLDVPYPGKPIDPAVWKAQSDFISRQAGAMYRDSLVTTEAGAILCAGLAECKPDEASQLDAVNDSYHLALKLKLAGLTGKTRPLAPPKPRTGSPALVLHKGTPAEAGMKADAKEKIDAVCRQWAEDSGEPFSVLVARHGVIVTHEGFGKTPDGTPVGTDYRTEIASITKALTGMLFGRLLDQGYVQIDDSIGRVVPGFPTSGEHMLTYRHLLTHTSGLSGHGEWGGLGNPYLDNVILNGIDCLHPGEAYNYNGMGFDLGGKAMEYMTGTTIARLMQEGLFAPLGITEAPPIYDLAFSGHLTSYELGAIAQCMANRGSYGDKQLLSEDTFAKLLPVKLSEHFPGVDAEYGTGLTYYRELRTGAPAKSKDPKDRLFSEHVIGHGSATSCILRADLDNGLIITQIRRTAGPKYDEYLPKFLTAVSEGMM